MRFEQFERLKALRELQAKDGADRLMTSAELAELAELEQALGAHVAAARTPAAELHARQVLEAKQRRERAERVVDTAIGLVDFGLSLVGGIFGRR